jgi:molecular chaperone HscB
MPDQEPDPTPPSAPAGADYFSVFDLPRKLALDDAALTRAFYRRSREVHPDRFAQASAEKQQWSLEQTSLLNDAYRALKDPVARTEYLLRLEGITLADDARAAEKPDSQGRKNVPPELLAEVFELNMQLEEVRMNAQMGEDDPQLRADLEAARTQFEAQFQTIQLQIQGQWTEWDAALATGDQPAGRISLEAMAALLDKRRYVRNLVRDVREALGS